MALPPPNVTIIEGDFCPGAIYSRDGKLLVLRKEFIPERAVEFAEHLDLRTATASFTITKQAAGRGLPMIGLLPSLLLSLFRSTTDNHLTHGTITLKDGRTFGFKAEPTVASLMAEAAEGR